MIAKSDSELQITVNELSKIIKTRDMKNPLAKQKGRDSVGGKNIKMVNLEIEGKIIEQSYNFNYLAYLISNGDNDNSIKLQRYNKMNGITKGKHMTTDTKLRIHDVTYKAALCYSSGNWIIYKRYAPKLELHT
jgi:hypothetical protein